MKKDYYSFRKVCKLFDLKTQNPSLLNFLKENIPYQIFDDVIYFPKNIIDDLICNPNKYDMCFSKLENHSVFYKKDSIEDNYISNYFTFSKIREEYQNITNKDIEVDGFEKLGINIKKYPIEYFSIGKRTFCFIPNNYFEEILNKFIIKETLKDISNPYEKYRVATSFISDINRYKFKNTLDLLQDFVNYSLNNTSNQMQQINSIILMQEMLIKQIDKEINLFDNKEITNLFIEFDTSKAQKNTLTKFLNYIVDKENVCFDLKLSIKREKKIKESEDFYSLDEWEKYINFIFDIDKHIEKAFSNYTYARYWLFSMLQCNLAWRLQDIISIPALDMLSIEKYNLEWFKNNTFTLQDAQIIVESSKRHIEQYHVSKTGAKKHFIIYQTFNIGVSIGFIICEQFRRNLGVNKLFNNIAIKYKDLVNSMGNQMIGFSNLKACRSLLTFVNEVDSLNYQSGGVQLASYMRSHKIDSYCFSDTTTIYLKSTFSEKDALSISMELNEIGLFGWFYNDLLKALDIEPQNKIKYITNLKEEFSPQYIQNISSYILNENKTRQEIMSEIMQLDETQLKSYVQNMFLGNNKSKVDDFYCAKHNCPFPTIDSCELCQYSIPSIHCVGTIGQLCIQIMDRIINEENATELDDKRRKYQLFKLLSVLKEAKEVFGLEFVNKIARYDEIKEKLIKIKNT